MNVELKRKKKMNFIFNPVEIRLNAIFHKGFAGNIFLKIAYVKNDLRIVHPVSWRGKIHIKHF